MLGVVIICEFSSDYNLEGGGGVGDFGLPLKIGSIP